MSNETETNQQVAHVETFDGYLAELIRVQAEKFGKKPDEFVLSFFEIGCNAPNHGDRSQRNCRVSFFAEGAMHSSQPIGRIIRRNQLAVLANHSTDWVDRQARKKNPVLVAVRNSNGRVMGFTEASVRRLLEG